MSGGNGQFFWRFCSKLCLEYMNFTEKSHEAVAGIRGKIFYAVDATVGGGRDALFAASIMEPSGKLFCFDVQAEAIARSKKLIEENAPECACEFFHAGHEHMKELLPRQTHGRINCFFFNLGWLPGSDKKIATRAETTIEGLSAAFELADRNACVISVCCYKAHEGGMSEFRAVERFMEANFSDCKRYTDTLNDLSPELFIVKFGG